MISPNKRIYRQQRVRAKRTLITGGYVPRQYALPLILGKLVVAVRRLKPVARGKEVQMEHAFRGRLPVEVIENALVVTPVVNRQALRCIQKMSRSNTAECDEISVLRSTDVRK